MNECTQGFPVFEAFSETMPRNVWDNPGATGRWHECPDLKTVSENWESETRACEKCGRRFTLYDDDMR